MLPLESCTLFNSLRAEELAALKSATCVLEFAPGAEIFQEGDPGDALCAVASGSVTISVLTSNGSRLPISTIEAGDMFGEMAAIDSQPRSATVVAASPT